LFLLLLRSLSWWRCLDLSGRVFLQLDLSVVAWRAADDGEEVHIRVFQEQLLPPSSPPCSSTSFFFWSLPATEGKEKRLRGCDGCG